MEEGVGRLEPYGQGRNWERGWAFGANQSMMVMGGGKQLMKEMRVGWGVEGVDCRDTMSEAGGSAITTAVVGVTTMLCICGAICG